MTFSLRTTFLCLAYVACWLGAITTGNSVMVDLMVCVSMWILFLTLPLAIWDSNMERRPFWGGFFAVGIANILLFFSTLSFGGPIWNPPPPMLPPGTFQVVGAPAFPPSVTPIPAVAPNAGKTQSLAWLRVLTILVSPVLGGIVVYTFSRKRDRITAAIAG